MLRRRAAQLGLFVPRNQRSLYEDRMHLNEQTPSRLRRSLARHFPHVRVWVGSRADPVSGLRAPPGRAMLRTQDSIYAVAALAPIDLARLRDALAQDEIDPTALGDVRLRIGSAPARMPAGRLVELAVELDNASGVRLASRPPYPVHVSYHWIREDGALEIFDGLRTGLGDMVEPGERRAVAVRVLVPSVKGRFDLVVTLVQEGQFWLEAHAPAAKAVAPGIEVD
jgi:hypothetical protein